MSFVYTENVMNRNYNMHTSEYLCFVGSFMTSYLKGKYSKYGLHLLLAGDPAPSLRSWGRHVE